jgi:glycosyltransferase involved in cell wall biosynthesis
LIMNNTSKVYEVISKWDVHFIRRHLGRGFPVWVIEPFPAYHHKKGIRFFPPHLPPYVEETIKSGKILVLKAEEINAKEIYSLSADKAVNVTESVFPEYRKKYENIFGYVSSTLKSPAAENVFRINLCNRIAEFYSMNILLHRIEKRLAPGPILVYPDINVYSYLFIKKLFLESNQEFYEHPNIQFPIQAYVTSFWEDLKQNLISTAKVLAQTLASRFLGRHKSSVKEKKRNFSYGMTIVSPRQLRDNERGPGFIIDNKEILASEVVYFPLIPLTRDQEETLAKMPGEVYHLPKGMFFSHYDQWKRILFLSLKEKFMRNGEELLLASNTLLNYFLWQKTMEDLSIRHFITHVDFGIGHVGRNIALNQAGVQTWYFTDSANLGVNLEKGEKCVTRHPFWSYLYYNHLVTWDAGIAEYYKEHPGSFEKTHIVGCLWSEHIREKTQYRGEMTSTDFKNLDNFYVLSCFDSTYSRNGLASYQEGIAFAEHLLKLIEECPDIYIILKEKKDRNLHYTLDPVLGPKLIEIYNRMSSHPRVKICSNQVDASELISLSDMVVSFPFTSTTFEALSTNKPAVWHDPVGCYRDTLYGKVGGVVTHSYDELKTKVLEIKDQRSDYQNPIPMDSPLMDPYRDKKAIDRFRKLLKSS